MANWTPLSPPTRREFSDVEEGYQVRSHRHLHRIICSRNGFIMDFRNATARKIVASVGTRRPRRSQSWKAPVAVMSATACISYVRVGPGAGE